jgi:WD40 repeat protein
VAVYDSEGWIEVIDVRSKATQWKWQSHRSPNRDGAGEPIHHVDGGTFLDDSRLLTVGGDAVVRCWDLETRQETFSLPAPASRYDLALNPSKTLLAVVARGETEVYDLPSRTKVCVLLADKRPIQSENDWRHIPHIRQVCFADDSTFVVFVAAPASWSGVYLYQLPLIPEG